MSFIEKIQNQPRRKRLVVLWLSTGVIMAIIIAVWLFSFSHSLEKIKNNKTSNAQRANAEISLPSLFESIKKDFSALKNIISSGKKEMNTQIENLQNEQNNINSQNNGQEGEQ